MNQKCLEDNSTDVHVHVLEFPIPHGKKLFYGDVSVLLEEIRLRFSFHGTNRSGTIISSPVDQIMKHLHEQHQISTIICI